MSCSRPRRAALTALLFLSILPACASAASVGERPDWWSYTRPAAFGAVSQPVRVPMRDGITLGCTLTRPALGGRPAAGRFPGIVYDVTPYALLAPFLAEQGDYFARRGYVAISCTVRGSGSSGGQYPQINQPAEQTDAYDLVEWLAARPFSNGRIGQTGESYGGMMAYRAAAARPPHLRAIAPQQAPNDLYLDDIVPGGIPARPVTRQIWPLVGQLTSLGRIDPARLYATQARHPLRDAFWEQIAIDTVLDRIEVPVLAFSGLGDQLFRNGAVRNVERLTALGRGDSTWLIAGPWEHNYPVDWAGCRVIAAACVGFQRVPPGALLAWFDRWVAERPEAPLPASRLTSFQSGLGGRGWRELGSVAAFSSQEPAVLPLGGSGALGGAAGPAGTASWRADPRQGLTQRVAGLVFSEAPSAAARELLGRPVVRLSASLSGADANLHASLRAVGPGGDARVLGEAWLRASHRDSHAAPTRLRAGEAFRADLVLPPVDVALPAGTRLQLRLDSGSAALMEPLPTPVRIDVRTGTGGATLELPLR